MLDNIRKFIPDIHKEGHFFISIFVICTLILFMWSQHLGWIGVIATLWCVFFFRDPERVSPIGKNTIVSPADGIIIKIDQSKLPSEIDVNQREMKRVSIFLSVFDVHVNRIPVSSRVKKLSYHYGKFFNASLDKAHQHNERQSILLETEDKQEICVVQIAGLIARRIVCNLQEEQEVATGQRFGIIRFGSRVDIYLPIHFNIQVLEGQRMVGGETIVATFKEAIEYKNHPSNY